MHEETLDSLADVAADPEVDLPRGRAELELLARFLDRNPGFDAAVTDEELDRLRSAPDDVGVDLPERSADRERLVILLQRHDDVDMLQTVLAVGHTSARGDAQGHQPVAETDGGPTGETDPDDGDLTDELFGTSDEDDDVIDWFIPDDEVTEEMASLGTDLALGAGVVVCLVAIAASLWSGVRLSDGSPLVFVEVVNLTFVLSTAVAISLVLGIVVGGVFRWTVDEPVEQYRRGIALMFAAVPFVGMVLLMLVQMLSPVVLELLALDLLGAVFDLVLSVVGIAILALPVLAGLMIGVGVVVWLPAIAGITLGTLLVSPSDVPVG